MSLRDQIVAESHIKKGPSCSVKILLSDLDGDDRQALLEALANPKIAATAIARALLKTGHRIGAHNLTRHRREQCSCDA